jgi:Carboxypeptidase regulatory-like domain
VWPAALVVLVALGLSFAASARASGGSLSGTLVYSDTTPASRVLVLVVPANATGEVQTYETVTNAQGEWSLSSIPAGEYNVTIIVVPASGEHETRTSQTVTLTEGQSLSLGIVNIGAPAVSEARTEAEIIAQGTVMVTVNTAEGLPANGAMLTIQGSIGGGSATVPTGGVVTEKVRNGPVTLSATDTPPDSATQVSATAQATITANATTTVTLTLPAGTPLALPAGIAASNSERDLGYLNAERTRWGLPAGVTLDSAWSQACAAHDTYLADNKLLEHPEDASLPGASPAGAWAGLHSILAGGAYWTAEGNPWEDAPIHLNQLYTPNLDVVGIDESRDTCTTTWPGIGAPLQPGGTIITYPGDGTTGFPPAELATESPFVPGKFVGLPEGTIAGREIFVYEEPGACSLLSCLGLTAPDVESATLTGPSGPVEVRTVSGNTSEVGGYLTGAIIIPVKPLAANASYTAEVALAPYGELPAESHRWTFQTGPANPDGAWPTKSSSSRAASRQTARISRLRIAPAAFLTVRRGRRHTTGALVTYLDSAKGTVTFGVNRLTSGIVIGGRCAAAKGRTAHKRRCTRYTRVYSINHNDRPGKNSFRLTGRYGHRRLAPGRYQLAVIGSPANATFTVTR